MRIIYLDIDTTRPDHLSCYGYHRPTTPNIDALAADGVRFTRYYTPDAPCLPSRAALYSGCFGIRTGVVGHGGNAAEPKNLIGKERGFADYFVWHGVVSQLRKLGFYTAQISPFAERHGAHWFTAGFREVHNPGQGGMESGEEFFPTVEKWLGEHAAQDQWYLHVNFWDPHYPFRAPASFGEPFAKDPLPAWLDSDETIQRHMKVTGPKSLQDLAMYSDQEFAAWPRQPGKVTDRAGMRKLIDGYDTGIRYADDFVGRIIAQLKAAGIYEETAIIVSSDHGENFGELGLYTEHGTADEITCRIPMIIKWPGGQKGAVDSGFHYNLDLGPTLMELLGGTIQGMWDGQSYAGAITEGKAKGRDYLVLSQCCHVCQRSVRWDNYLYMRTYHDGFHLFPQEMVFDLAADPHEQHDLAPQRPDLCKEGAWRLLSWHDEQMAKVPDQVDPLWTVIAEGGPMHALHDPARSPLPKYLERLEATGRADGAAALREKYKAYLK